MPDAAELYNAMNPWTGRSDDRFYLDLVLAADSVLDVGCGTGTLLSQARAKGHRGRLVGVDPDPDMLAQAKVHDGIEWLPGDMSTVSETGFELAVMTGHAFQCLLTDEDVLATLRGVRRAAGRFVFETRNALVREWERWPDMSYEFEYEGQTAKVFYEVRPIVGDVVDVVENIVADDWRRADAGQLRFLATERLDELIAEAGLEIEARYGGWQRQPFAPDSPELISVLRPVTM